MASPLALLPEHLTIYEVWLTRLFLLLGILTLAPWLLLIAYDFAVYIIRLTAYELPVLGGRAHGQARPRAPSLREREPPRLRAFSGASVGDAPVLGDNAASASASASARADGAELHAEEGARRRGGASAVRD